eukprot:scaffold47091_cov26-Prasinocladus_malaysianus.AAC.1
MSFPFIDYVQRPSQRFRRVPPERFSTAAPPRQRRHVIAVVIRGHVSVPVSHDGIGVDGRVHGGPHEVDQADR